MPRPHRWSVTLVASSGRHPRWLDENGHFSSDPARALRLSAPEVAVQRLQQFMELHGWQVDVLHRFRLVPSPPLRESRIARLQPLQGCSWQSASPRQAA